MLQMPIKLAFSYEPPMVWYQYTSLKRFLLSKNDSP